MKEDEEYSEAKQRQMEEEEVIALLHQPQASSDSAVEAKATRLSAYFNLSNCAVGAGVLSLPYAMECTGLLLGLLIYVAMAATALYSLHLLIVCATATGSSSYEHMVEAAFGRYAANALKVIIVLYTFGVCVGYIIIVGDLLPPVIEEWLPDSLIFPVEDRSKVERFFLAPIFFQTAITLLVIAPLASLRLLDSLKYASMFAIVAVLFFTGVVVVHGTADIIEGDDKTSLSDKVDLFKFSPTIFVATPIIAFALGGHLQSVGVYSEMKKEHRTVFSWHVITSLVVLSLSGIYLAVSIFSYLRFLPGDEGGNILKKMITDKPDNVAVQLAALSMTVVVVLSYPLLSWPMRRSLDNLFFPGRGFSYRRHIAETALILLTTYIIAVAVGDLKVVFGLTGATGAVLVKFIVPAAVFLRLSYNNPHSSSYLVISKDSEQESADNALSKEATAVPIETKKHRPSLAASRWQKAAAWALLVVGTAVGIISTTIVLVDAFAGEI
ncbi:Amino acid permease-like protein [Balamuthia mandrillaris]